jgi:hypothetical protein
MSSSKLLSITAAAQYVTQSNPCAEHTEACMHMQALDSKSLVKAE